MREPGAPHVVIVPPDAPRFRDEIDTLVSRQHAAQDEALAAWERRRVLDAL